MLHPIGAKEESLTNTKGEKQTKTTDSKGKKNKADAAPPDEREAKTPKNAAALHEAGLAAQAQRDAADAARLRDEAEEARLRAEHEAAEQARLQAVHVPTHRTRKALVVGINAYPGANSLTNPINDATDMHAALERIGFKSTILTDCTHDVLQDAIIEFTELLNPGDLALFYFAGHGCEFKNSNYLICSDTPVADKWLKKKAINAQELLEGLQEQRAAFSVMLLDCCRTFKGMNRSMGSTRSIGDIGGLCEMGAEDAIIGFACAPKQDALDNPNERNGLYTKHLLKHIETRGLDIDILLRHVGQGVLEESNKTQRPYRNSSVNSIDAVLCS